MTNTVSMGEVKKLVNYFIDNNQALEEKGEKPLALGFEGPAGIGKTSIIRQIAKDRGMGFVKINMAQLEEAGDLIGFPLKEYECQIFKQVKQEDGKIVNQVYPKTFWMNEKQLDAPRKGFVYQQTGKTRMTYAKPAWVPEYNENGTILLLDDVNRANQTLLKACMEVFLEQKYVSWSLPNKTTVVATQNPDDGSYNVEAQDEAQIGRYFLFNTEYAVNDWSAWAEKAGVDGRCINFVMNYSDELFKADADGNRICNPRSFVMFANAISGIKNWDDPENLAFITTIAKGCFKDEEGRFSQMFSAFLRNKMHLIIQPKEMLHEGWDTVKGKLSSLLYDSNGDYRGDIASLLERRFCNYIAAWLDSDDKTPISVVKDRILEFIDHDKKDVDQQFFNQDLYYHMIKTITSDHKRQTQKLLFEPKIANIISSNV